MIEVSTVIPVYNAESTIAETLTSIVNQTHKSDEVIVVDDGSSDSTAEVVSSFKGVRYIYQENAGVSLARNRGSEAARSEWLAFCDSDDIWHPTKLQVFSKCIEENPEALFIFSDFFVFDSSGTLFERGTGKDCTVFPIFRENQVSMKNVFQSLKTFELDLTPIHWGITHVYSGNAMSGLILGNFILPSTVLIKRKVFLDTGGFDAAFSSAEDTELFLRIAKQIIFSYIDLPLIGYRKSSTGLTGNKLSVLKNGLEAFEKNCLNDPLVYKYHKGVIRKGLGRRHSRMAYYCLSVFQRRASMEYALRAICNNPLEKRAWLCILGAFMPLLFLNALVRLKKRCRRTPRGQSLRGKP